MVGLVNNNLQYKLTMKSMTTAMIMAVLLITVYGIESNILKDKGQIDTSSPVRLFAKSDKVSLLNKLKLVTVNHNGWVNIGFDHVIEAKDDITLDVVAKTPRDTDNALHFCVGFASKDVSQAVRNILGNYINGWCYRNNGHIYADTKQGKWIGDFTTNQAVRLRFMDYKIVISVQGIELDTIDVKDIFDRYPAIDFYPAFSLHGPGATVEIVDFRAKQSHQEL